MRWQRLFFFFFFFFFFSIVLSSALSLSYISISLFRTLFSIALFSANFFSYISISNSLLASRHNHSNTQSTIKGLQTSLAAVTSPLGSIFYRSY
jgi:hypothetical protein